MNSKTIEDGKRLSFQICDMFSLQKVVWILIQVKIRYVYINWKKNSLKCIVYNFEKISHKKTQCLQTWK